MNTNMKWPLVALGIAVVLIGAFFVLNPHTGDEKQAAAAPGYKDAEYLIDGRRVRLHDGFAETEAAPGSASKITTRYFGNEVTADLDGDGRDDAVFLLTQQTGGSGTFYYAVAARNTASGYAGSDAYLLGDRIAPQTTELSRDPGRKGVVVVNYFDRAAGEPMTARPSVGKSVWLKLDPQTMRLGAVEQNFEGEADPSAMSLTMKPWTWVSALYGDGRSIAPKEPGRFTITFAKDGRFSATTDCNSMSGAYTADGHSITFGPVAMTAMFCEGSQEGDFSALLKNTQDYRFTSRGELVLGIKPDNGTATFK